MLNNTEFLTLSGNLFTLINHQSKCLIDILHNDNGEEIKKLKIKKDPSKPIKFAYTPEWGMVKLNKSGSITKDAVLDELLSIQDGDINSLINYIEKYGFIIPISDSKFEEFSFESIFSIVRRIQYTIKLMAKIQEPTIDYNSVLYFVSYLIFAPIVTINSIGRSGYDSCEHPIINLINNVDFAREYELKIYPSEEAEYSDKYLLIPDTLSNSEQKLYLADYYSSVNQNDLYDKPIAEKGLAYNEILFLYKNAHNHTASIREAIDFFYHLQKDISPIKSIKTGGVIEFCRNDIEKQMEEHFDTSMKQALLKVARQTIKEEIDHAISAIKPNYNMENMTASWYVPDFIAGIYFSLFYMDSSVVIYRKCQNPSCIGYFRVSTTNSKKKYCNDACRNAAGQRRHRFNKKRSEE